MRRILLVLFVMITSISYGQSELTVKKIMQDPSKWVGTSPSNPYWSEDGKTLYFRWNPEQNPSDSLYKLNAPWTTPAKVSQTEQRAMTSRSGDLNKGGTKKVYIKNGDVFIREIKTGKTKQITRTVDSESSPSFTNDEKGIYYIQNQNLYLWEMETGLTMQITNFVKGSKKKSEKTSEQDKWLKKDQEMFLVLEENKERREQRSQFQRKYAAPTLGKINIGNKSVSNVEPSPKGDYVTYTLFSRGRSKRTIVPDYVTESGYTTDLNARSKVGNNPASLQVGIFNIKTGKSYKLNTEGLSGLNEAPAYYAEYDLEFKGPRKLLQHSPIWSGDGNYAVVSFRSKDNKDRWIALLDPATGDVKELDRQHDDAWIAGPGIGWSFSSGTMGWMPDNKRIYFQSEETGYSHLYALDVTTGAKKALTSGNFEIYNPRISKDGKSWYFESNKNHPGIVQVFKMPLNGGAISAVTDMGGRAVGYLSPDESKMAVLHSKSNQPNELYVQILGKKPTAPKKVTDSQTDEWKAYDWRQPDFITFEARDGAEVHARLYKPSDEKSNGAGVIFVHGAGYLQNAHQWWSSYFREYMFHNLLTDKGYTVLDIDYRGSAGYGRDWRTGIYQHMGGFDLSDQVDGAKHLIDAYDIDPERIGIYGGSYGGFITLMAMFNEAETFAAGAALRSVTDWAHYNHGYTSNILNTPVTDSLAYRKSSPIYYAEGLEGALLICHGMIDTNVHFQDVVRLAQRLIELGKENWEFAVYPKEGHGFRHPTSWTDEYSRILKLFEDNLK